MLDDLIIQPEDRTPIFQQLEHQLLRFIRAGRLPPGAELPSVRAMAAHLAVNPMTVSKTINRLVEQGWLEHQRGKPTRVVLSLPQHTATHIDQQLDSEIARLVSHSRELGLDVHQLIERIHAAWNREGES